MAELENIDTQADKMSIAFVKICDLVSILYNFLLTDVTDFRNGLRCMSLASLYSLV